MGHTACPPDYVDCEMIRLNRRLSMHEVCYSKSLMSFLLVHVNTLEIHVFLDITAPPDIWRKT